MSTMTTSNSTPVTLAEIFQYAEVYGVDITIAHEPIYPGRYVVKFTKDGVHRADALQRIDLDRPDFDEMCRYILTAGCEKLNRGMLNHFVEATVGPKFEEVIEHGDSYSIVRDSNTDALYLVVYGYQQSVMTPIYNTDGTVRTYSEFCEHCEQEGEK